MIRALLIRALDWAAGRDGEPKDDGGPACCYGREVHYVDVYVKEEDVEAQYERPVEHKILHRGNPHPGKGWVKV